MIPGAPLRRTSPRRRHSQKVYVRRQVLAVVVSITLIFAVLLGLDHLVRLAFPGHGHTATSSKSPTRSKTHATTPPPTTPPVNAPAGKNSVSIAAAGDVALGTAGSLPPDPTAYLGEVRSALVEPIAFANLDGTLTDATTSKCKAGSNNCFAFRDPPSYARVLRTTGFTVLNSANDHSHDFGTQGVTDTSAALKSAGIVQTGLPGQVGVTSDRRSKVAFVGFAPNTVTNNLLNLSAAKALISKARTLAPIVIVYMDAGAEGASADHVTGKDETYQSQNRGNPEAFAHAAIDAGASAVVASGPHVLRGIEFYKGHLIDYSLGDFAGYGTFSASGYLDLSGILKLHLSPTGAFESASWISVLLNQQGQPSVDTTGQAAVFVNGLSSQDFGTAAAKIQPDGSIVPVTPGAVPTTTTTPTTTTPTTTTPTTGASTTSTTGT